MEDNRKGNGIFLGIVGVATLIVAIIGASFAYFSAQASSAEGAVNLTAYEFNAGLSLREIYPSDAKLIPVDPTTVIENATAPNNTNLAYALIRRSIIVLKNSTWANFFIPNFFCGT